MRVIVTGSRDWTDEASVFAALFGVLSMMPKDETLIVIEGGASGADHFAAKWCIDLLFVEHENFPADWTTYRKAAGPIRNREMLKAGADLVLAFSNDLAKSNGTRDMVNIAKAAGVRTILHTVYEPPIPEPPQPTLFGL